MKTKVVKFKNRDGLSLAARLEMPVDGNPDAYALFAHCFTCTKNLKAVKNINDGLTRKGIAVLRFDFTGLGESEGDFADTNFSSNINDLIDATEYLKEKYEAPSILVGHSLGGAAVILAASQIDSVKAVATIGAPYDPGHIKHLLKESVEEINETGEAEVSIGGRPFKIKKQFLDDIETIETKDILENLGKSLLVLHSPQDNIVGIDNAAKIYKAAKHPKSFITLDGADHLLSKQDDSFYAGNVIGSWVSRYIESQKREELESQNQITVRIGEEDYTSDIKSGVHQLIADEPKDYGGNDLGPSPYDYLLASLGSCTVMTLRMYADRKKWDLKEVKVHLDHSKTHAEDCNKCEENSNNKIDSIERIIELDGDLDDEQRNRLLEIADKCPVHRTLNSEINIETKLKN